VPNGSLAALIEESGPFSLAVVKFYAAQLVLAIEYMHSQMIIHRDLKPQNILLSDQNYLKIVNINNDSNLIINIDRFWRFKEN
jgi:serine/threonine protein kinase